MHIAEQYITDAAKALLNSNPQAAAAYREISTAVCGMTGSVNNAGKNCNGVVPLKEPCYRMLEEDYGWYREKPLDALAEKGGPIDVYKAFGDARNPFRVGIEFETGNISSAHRSMNKLKLGTLRSELDLAVLLMPMHRLSYYLTDRVSNYEELRPYFSLAADSPFIIIGFDVEIYSPAAACLPKGRDGMSERSVRKWKNRR